MDKIIIDIDQVVSDDSSGLIILHKTGIFYTGQCGGISCTHPYTEGYLIDMGSLGDDIDECSFGCAYLESMPEKQKELGEVYDKMLQEYCKPLVIDLRFDFDRVTETQEGWIPLLLSGSPWGINQSFDNQQCILHTGNCD